MKRVMVLPPDPGPNPPYFAVTENLFGDGMIIPAFGPHLPLPHYIAIEDDEEIKEVWIASGNQCWYRIGKI